MAGRAGISVFGLWAVFTVFAAGAQTARNALQRGLTAELGTVGATHVRFLYGFPFALIFLLLVSLAAGRAPPGVDGVFLLWVLAGGLAQILATALMLAAMAERSFVVTVAYTKTEPVQVAVFAVVVLGETVTAGMAAATVIATLGVLVMSWPRAGAVAGAARDWRPAGLGIAAGAMFALAAVAFKGAIVDLRAVADPGFVLAATTTLAWGLGLQAALLTLYLAVTDRPTLGRVLAVRRASLTAGFMGAFASQMWFLAFALEQVARVRTLGLVEVLFSWAISGKLLKERPSGRDLLGVGLILAGVLLLLNS
jgi:drug/metabolite transporter (DMT)-like permease